VKTNHIATGNNSEWANNYELRASAMGAPLSNETRFEMFLCYSLITVTLSFAVFILATLAGEISARL